MNPSTKGVGNLARIKSPTFVRCCLAVDVLPIRRRLRYGKNNPHPTYKDHEGVERYTSGEWQHLPVIKGKGSTEAPVRQKRGTNKDILYSRGENTGDSFITAAQQLARSDSKGRSNKKALQTLVRAGFIKDSGDGEFQFADVHEVPRRNRKFFDKVFSAYEDESDKY